MSNTTYTDLVGPPVNAAWLNDVNNTVYNVLGNGTTVPTNGSAVVTNLGLNASGGAAEIGFAPTGSIASTNVQAAITEVVADLEAPTGAGLVGVTPTGSVTATTVQGAIAQLAVGGGVDATTITYTPQGTGAVATHVANVLYQTLSVFDFLTTAQIADVQARTMTYDLSVPIQNALNAAMSSSNPRAVYFPAGTYKCANLSYASSVYHLKIYGDGSGHTILINTIDTNPVITFTSSPNQITVDGITFRGNGSVRSWGSGNGAGGNSLSGSIPTSVAAVRMIDLVHADFHDCYFQDAKWGVDIQGGIIVNFNNCYAYYNGEVGYRIWKNTTTGYPNIVSIKEGGVLENGQVGVYFDQGRQLIMDTVDVEGNGNNTVQASGLACGLYVGSQTGVENGASNGPNSTAFHTLSASVKACWFEKNGNNTGGGTPSSTQTAHVISNHGFIHVEDCIMTNCTAGRHFRINGGQYSIERCAFESALTVSTNYVDEGVTTGNASLVKSNYINNCFFNTPGTTADLTSANCTVDTTKTFFNYGGSGGGGTPTLDQVVTAGSSTTTNITVGSVPVAIGTFGGIPMTGASAASSYGISAAGAAMLIASGQFYPNANNTISLGTNSARFSSAYVQGTFQWGGYNITPPTGSTSTYLRADGTWSTVSVTETDTLATVTSRGNTASTNITVGSGSQATLGTTLGVAAVGGASASAFAIFTSSSNCVINTSAFYPGGDNTLSCGLGSNRWSVVYAATGTINTSDLNQKQDVRELSEVEKLVALRLKGLIRSFKFKDAVAAKGDNARIHVGVIAQDVKAAFEAEGLDANNYGVFCSDTLEDGTVQLGVRYEELFAFIISVL